MSTVRILDGKAIAKEVRSQVQASVQQFAATFGRPPSLHVVLVGSDPASQVYVRNKNAAATKAGIHSVTHTLGDDASQAQVMELVDKLNADREVNGILVQLPLPKGLQEAQVIDLISPQKDVDGLHPMNVGLMTAGRDAMVPCTPQGCMRLIAEAHMDPKGRRAVVIGRSLLMGKPVAQLLLAQHATVTMAHSRTRDLDALCREADILVVAVGKPKLVQGDWIRPGAVVIDVGINRLEDGTLVGDVDFDAAKLRAGAITPVPGGVGPMTIAYLLQNTVVAATRQMKGK